MKTLGVNIDGFEKQIVWGPDSRSGKTYFLCQEKEMVLDFFINNIT